MIPTSYDNNPNSSPFYGPFFNPCDLEQIPPPCNPHYIPPSDINYPDLPFGSYQASLPHTQSPSGEQIEAWSKCLRLYTRAVSMIFESGLQKIDQPDYDLFRSLHQKSFKAQGSLNLKALNLASKVSNFVRDLYVFLATIFAVKAVYHSLLPPSLGFSPLVTDLCLLFFSVTAFKTLQVASKIFNKASIAWMNSYFSKEEKAQIELLKKWKKVENLNDIEVAIEEFRTASSEAIIVDGRSGSVSERREWNAEVLQDLECSRLKIIRYNTIDHQLSTHRENGQRAYLLHQILKA